MRKLILSLILLALPASVQMAHSQSTAQAGARDTIETTQYWLAETEYIRAAVDQFSTPLIDAYQIMDAVTVGTISEKDANSTLTPLLETIDRHEALLLNAVNDVQEPFERGYSATSPSMTRAYLTQLVTSYATVNRLNLEYIIARVRQQDRAHQIFQEMYQETQANLLYDRQRMDLEIELLEANQMPRLPHPQVMVIELFEAFVLFGDAIYMAEVARMEVMQYRVSISAQ